MSAPAINPEPAPLQGAQTVATDRSDRQVKIDSFADPPAPTECPTSFLEPIMTVLERASVCTLDGPDTCSLTVEVEGDRIVKVRGSDALPYTGGITCNKVGRYELAVFQNRFRLAEPAPV
jgi:hypothetical protein